MPVSRARSRAPGRAVHRESQFSDRLAALVAERRSQVVLGLDPDPARLLPSAFEEAGEGGAAERAGRAVAAQCRLLVEAAGPACVAVKLQLACFERLGTPGWAALVETAAVARAAGLLVIADGKRGDVPVTAAAYAQALVGETPTPWGPVTGLGADALTANPLLGRDSLEPLLQAARAAEAGVFVLVRTSNAGAGDLQDLAVDGGSLHEHLARMVDELGADSLGHAGLSDVGAVVGATQPEHIAGLRRLMPRAVMLLPGVGAQGGQVDGLAAAFGPHSAAALVAVSRGIADAHERVADAGDPLRAARAEAESLRAAVWEVSGG